MHPLLVVQAQLVLKEEDEDNQHAEYNNIGEEDVERENRQSQIQDQ
jgi:hypothetical protein